MLYEAKNCLSLAKPMSFFRADGVFSKNFRIYTEHLIFLVTFFISPSLLSKGLLRRGRSGWGLGKIVTKDAKKNSNKLNSRRVNLKDRA